MNCPACQAGVPEKAKFCLECGIPLSGLSAAPAVQTAPPAQAGISTSQSGATSLGDWNTVGARRESAPVETTVPFVPLADRYDLREPLGSGGFATVYRAQDRNLRRQVAIKRLHVRMGDSPEAMQTIERFSREALAVAQLSHRNIVAVYEQARDADGHYIVMELIEGGTLHDHYRKAGKLPVEDALPLLKGVCRGLSYAHKRNMVHRDIKPGNILLADEDGELIPKIVDFGLARIGFESETSPSRSGYGLGTPFYMAPEQRRDAKSVNHTADIYAVGKTLFELVTGEAPDNVDPELLANLPDLAKIVFRCIKTRPEDRYFSIDELLADLDKVRPASSHIRTSALPVATADELARRNACAACGTSNKPDDRFCLACGAGLVRPCPECQKEASLHVRFCGVCGTDREAFQRMQDALGRMETYAAERVWSRIVKEFELTPLDARIPGERGQQLRLRLQGLAATARNAEAEIELLKDSSPDVPPAAALHNLLRLQSILPPDAALDARIAALQQLEAERIRVEAERQAAIALAEVEQKRKEWEAQDLTLEAERLVNLASWDAALQQLSKVDPDLRDAKFAAVLTRAQSGASALADSVARICADAQRERVSIQGLCLPATIDEAIRRTEELLSFVEPHTARAPLQDHAAWASGHLSALRKQKLELVNVDEDFLKARQALALSGNSRHYTEKVWLTRLPVWKAAAEMGNPRGLWLVGDCQLEGLGGPRDLRAAFENFRQAAEQREPAAQITVGRMYASGQYVAEDPVAAVTWWRKAADQGDLEAVCELARCYLRGRGIDADPARGVAMLQDHSARSDARVISQLAHCYNAGLGVPKDATKAFRLFQQAAEMGKVDAMYHAAVALLSGKGTPKNQPQAVQWLRRAADAGNLAAMTKLEELGLDSGRAIQTNSVGMELR